jgi:hypothetical protein
MERDVMKRENYNGFVIEARRSELQNDLGWSPLLRIEKHDSRGVTAKEIAVMGIYKTESEAIESALAHGRKCIDDGFKSGD